MHWRLSLRAMKLVMSIKCFEQVMQNLVVILFQFCYTEIPCIYYDMNIIKQVLF